MNVKSGCVVDVAGNLMFAPNTNALKLSSKSQSEERAQAKIQAYNNTIVNAGWRRDEDKGGSIYVEENANVKVFNNLLVNCKFKATTPFWDQDSSDRYDRNNSVIDHNYYASGSQKIDEADYVYEAGIEYSWEGYNYSYTLEDEDDGEVIYINMYDTEKVDKNSIVATEDDSKDPKFTYFDINAVRLLDYQLFNNERTQKYDFHLQAGSPVLTGAYDGSDATMQPYFGTSGLTVNGKTYTSPKVEARFGAYGTK